MFKSSLNFFKTSLKEPHFGWALLGFLAGLLCHFGFWILTLNLMFQPTDTASILYMVFNFGFGLLQWIYLYPLYLIGKRIEKPAFGAGVLLLGGVTMLFWGACSSAGGLMLYLYATGA